MAQIILTSAAWYALPKGIDYLTSRPSSLESRIDRVRARLFAYKATLSRLANTNPLIENLKSMASMYYSNMWLAILIAPGFQKIMPFKGFDSIFWRIFTCHILFICKLSKPDCIKFMKSDAALEYMTSSWGLRCINIFSSFSFTKTHILRFIKSHLPDCLASDQLISILDKKLRPSDAYDLLNASYSPEYSRTLFEEGGIIVRFFDSSLAPLDRVRGYNPSARDELFNTIFSNAIRAENVTREYEIRGSFREDHLDGDLIETGASIIRRIKSCRSYIANMQSSLQELPLYAEDIHDTDPILNQIQCPISLRAIRRTITDPTNEKTVYDYESFKIWLEHSRTSPVTRKKIPESFDVRYEGGSRYDSILRYRKTLLQSGELQNPEEFIANLKDIFEEIGTLNDANDIKDASEKVRTFFQKGILNAYDSSYLHALDSCKACKRRHNQDLNDRKEETFQNISLQEVEQSRFIKSELNLEIEKIKTKKEDLIEDFCKPNS
ncbi:hypothetical protein RHABOEDO_000373 [Candidatus Rhabdochlamydia oedothoracis]|uniref:U-box domain-containing protein n=1 Tax=Candidatus Rhabdochlamydia oedothoracis TaxID=2720720 RepID=A0ABX8V4U9_9BACT|nr:MULTISPECIES: hypothetical protein [Rhabdochlamydia]KAG6558622.1 hypothetical protein RHOW815_001389 [Candidatus Rhabdochlamydia sp. W815]MCL6756615.1 hypothetical protein [Candidatus Rhabdochlamydia oedothoracis]QYF48249.1 hypothetical protein RHABOEDO_000373 [Candidatus Rhabdochlamydia oedothoracis]